MTEKAPIIFVVDDDEAVRASLYALIRSIGLQVETFATAADFLNAFQPDQPGCLVLDIRMPGMSGLELQQELSERKLPIPVIIITGHGDVPVAVKAMKCGAFEFLEKPFSKQLLLEHVRRAVELDRYSREEHKLIQDINDRLANLTEREQEVLAGILTGKVSKQIAVDLDISKKTVDVHRANVMKKMNAETIAALVEQVVLARHANGKYNPGSYLAGPNSCSSFAASAAQ